MRFSASEYMYVYMYVPVCKDLPTDYVRSFVSGHEQTERN